MAKPEAASALAHFICTRVKQTPDFTPKLNMTSRSLATPLNRLRGKNRRNAKLIYDLAFFRVLEIEDDPTATGTRGVFFSIQELLFKEKFLAANKPFIGFGQLRDFGAEVGSIEGIARIQN